MRHWKLALMLWLIVAITGVTLYMRFAGVTNEQIAAKVDDRADELAKLLDDRAGKIVEAFDARYEALEKKLDSVDSKLDRILRLAAGPLPDGMERSK